MSTLVDPSDPTRYTSGYALVVLTDSERGLQRMLAAHAGANVLQPTEREQFAHQLRKARTAALKASRGQDGH